MSISVEEKRRFIRFRLLAHGTITLDGGEMFQGTLRDISIGGAFLDVRDFPMKNVNQEVVAYIEVSIDGEKHVIDAHAKIARISRDGVGLFFSNMDSNSKASFSIIMQRIRERTQAN